MVGSCDVKFPIRLEGLVLTHGQFSRYRNIPYFLVVFFLVYCWVNCLIQCFSTSGLWQSLMGLDPHLIKIEFTGLRSDKG
jgi:hypothetical protein